MFNRLGISLGFACIVTAVVLQLLQSRSPIAVLPVKLQVGELEYNVKRQFRIPIANAGFSSLLVTPSKSNCSCRPVSLTDEECQAGKGMEAIVEYTPMSAAGAIDRTAVQFETNDPLQPKITVFLEGRMKHGVVPNPSRLTCNGVAVGSSWETSTILSATDAAPFGIEAMWTSVPGVTLLADEADPLRIIAKGEAVASAPTMGKVYLITTHPRHRLVELPLCVLSEALVRSWPRSLSFDAPFAESTPTELIVEMPIEGIITAIDPPDGVVVDHQSEVREGRTKRCHFEVSAVHFRHDTIEIMRRDTITFLIDGVPHEEQLHVPVFLRGASVDEAADKASRPASATSRADTH